MGSELADKQKGDKDTFRGFVLFLVAVTAIYCTDPSNVELFAHTRFKRELTIFDLIHQKNGLPL